MKILSIVGARPQFIKEAIVGEELRKSKIEEILVHTGQHYDLNMSEVFFEVLNIKKPDYNLGIGSGLHAYQTGIAMIEIEKIAMDKKPDYILVYGDTNATLAGALVASKLKIPLAHVEAGLRQEPRDMPEEINRIVTDKLSSLLFCPSELAIQNLKKEGIEKGVYNTGDVMYDLYLKMELLFEGDYYKKLSLKENEYIICTIHRDFNTDNPEKLKIILEQLNKISKEKQIIFPIHPRTRKKIKEFGFDNIIKNIRIIDPIDYLKLMGLVKHSWKIITDSGGLQKESYFAKKRAIIVMPDTGWKELTETSINLLSKPDEIFQKVFSNRKKQFKENIYGKGNSGIKIVKILGSFNN